LQTGKDFFPRIKRKNQPGPKEMLELLKEPKNSFALAEEIKNGKIKSFFDL